MRVGMGMMARLGKTLHVRRPPVLTRLLGFLATVALLVPTVAVVGCNIVGPRTSAFLWLSLLWLALAVPGLLYFGGNVLRKVTCCERGIAFRRRLLQREFPFSKIRLAEFVCRETELEGVPVNLVRVSIHRRGTTRPPFVFLWSLKTGREEAVFGPIVRHLASKVPVATDDRMGTLR